MLGSRNADARLAGSSEPRVDLSYSNHPRRLTKVEFRRIGLVLVEILDLILPLLVDELFEFQSLLDRDPFEESAQAPVSIRPPAKTPPPMSIAFNSSGCEAHHPCVVGAVPKAFAA